VSAGDARHSTRRLTSRLSQSSLSAAERPRNNREGSCSAGDVVCGRRCADGQHMRASTRRLPVWHRTDLARLPLFGRCRRQSRHRADIASVARADSSGKITLQRTAVFQHSQRPFLERPRVSGTYLCFDKSAPSPSMRRPLPTSGDKGTSPSVPNTRGLTNSEAESERLIKATTRTINTVSAMRPMILGCRVKLADI
jgi:hypothetical protein